MPPIDVQAESTAGVESPEALFCENPLCQRRIDPATPHLVLRQANVATPERHFHSWRCGRLWIDFGLIYDRARANGDLPDPIRKERSRSIS